jgi:peptide/nickel transport system permease protein
MMPGLAVSLKGGAKRLLTIVAVLWGAATLTFIAVKLIPGDPVSIIIGGGDAVVDPAFRAELIRKFGLDQPLWVQYLRYCGQALSGDPGISYQFRQPVVSVIGAALKQTLPLALSALVLALTLAIVNALATSGRQHRLRGLLSGVELILLSTPVYWIGILLLTIFSFKLQWFPVTGNEGIASLVLPALTLSLPLTAIFSQVLRDGLEEALAQPFPHSRRQRNQVTPAACLTPRRAGPLDAHRDITGWRTGGSILTETVFGRAGIGQITLLAIENRDMPLVLGIVMFSAFLFVVINLILDALYLLIDPRLGVKESTDEQ